MKENKIISRGTNRLLYTNLLPETDMYSQICYEGSISKFGDNADCDWGLFQDENGEWVLAEGDGPGCIYNFTQHRYPTSEVPVFRFYFDNSPAPQFEITPEQFGKKAPFLSPLADIFIGPEEDGRGPIWVVRSFVPMEFTKHFKVTSSIKLEGWDKSKGQGGWGHITYHMYDSADGLCTFDSRSDISEIIEKYSEIPAECPESEFRTFSIPSNGESEIFSSESSGCIENIALRVASFVPEKLAKLWVKIYFDGNENPNVYAPIGTFFGCEYGYTLAELKTAMLSWDITKETASFLNRFPMPFRKSCQIAIENRLGYDTKIFSAVSDAKSYNFTGSTGYFTSSEYYPPTDNTPYKNSVIADVKGAGHMVYGVISGCGIECGCEGDVRVFIDGCSSPAVESDGSESWGSYGWGFVCPPQCNPFSAYNGLPFSNSTWSELRLTFTDCYPFRSELRFELEHGCQNDGGGKHSGQMFFYMLPSAAEELIGEITPDSGEYSTDGVKERITDRFENGFHNNYESFICTADMSFSQFKAEIPADNAGIVLKRVSLQNKGRQCARVFINGERVTERDWLFPDSNGIYSLLEDSYTVPEKYTAGKSELTVRIEPYDGNWTECRYKVFLLKGNENE